MHNFIKYKNKSKIVGNTFLTENIIIYYNGYNVKENIKKRWLNNSRSVCLS